MTPGHAGTHRRRQRARDDSRDLALTDLNSAGAAIGIWIDAAGPLREQIAATMAALRKLVGADEPSAAAVVAALATLVATSTATDAWLDAAGPLRQGFADAVAAWQAIVGENGATETLGTAGNQIDAWLDAAGPLRQQMDDAISAACALLAADAQAEESEDRVDGAALAQALRNFWIAR